MCIIIAQRITNTCFSWLRYLEIVVTVHVLRELIKMFKIKIWKVTFMICYFIKHSNQPKYCCMSPYTYDCYQMVLFSPPTLLKCIHTSMAEHIWPSEMGLSLLTHYLRLKHVSVCTPMWIPGKCFTYPWNISEIPGTNIWLLIFLRQILAHDNRDKWHICNITCNIPGCLPPPYVDNTESDLVTCLVLYEKQPVMFMQNYIAAWSMMVWCKNVGWGIRVIITHSLKSLITLVITIFAH